MLKKKMLIGLSILVLLLFFSACGEPADGNPVWQAYSGKRIGVQVGTTSGQRWKPGFLTLFFCTITRRLICWLPCGQKRSTLVPAMKPFSDF